MKRNFSALVLASFMIGLFSFSSAHAIMAFEVAPADVDRSPTPQRAVNRDDLPEDAELGVFRPRRLPNPVDGQTQNQRIESLERKLDAILEELRAIRNDDR